jgi:hypothetical protein
MTPTTLKALEELKAADWFAKVGEPMRSEAPVVYVKSWQEALDSCLAQQWQDLKYEASDFFWVELGWRSVERQFMWNDLLEEVRPVTDELVIRKTAKIVREHRLPEEFLAEVKWDILHVAMEGEYFDLYQGGFYRSLAYVYNEGHFPCGWEGERPPAGKLRLY